MAEAKALKSLSLPQGERSAGFTLPRHLHRAILRLLRPAEAAARRLIIVAARNLAPPPALRATSPVNGGGINPVIVPMLVDSHVNLHSEKFADDLEEVIARAHEAGVGAMLTISDKLTSTEAIKEITDAHKNMWRSVGVHPHYAIETPDLSAETLIDLAKDEKVVGIGECGLDFYYGYSPQDVQEKVFRAHIAASRETGLPLWQVQVAALDATGGEVLAVTVAGEPSVSVGQMVAIQRTAGLSDPLLPRCQLSLISDRLLLQLGAALLLRLAPGGTLLPRQLGAAEHMPARLRHLDQPAQAHLAAA